MSQVITGLYNVPFSAASAGYAPTNTADVTALIDSAVSGKLDASASSSFITSTADCMPLSASSNYATTSDLADKLDASASSSFQPVGNYVSSDDLSAYQTVEGMSAYQSAGDYATTAQLAEKLDASASSSFVTSTADCMPLASSSEFYSTSNPAGYITGVDLTPYAESSSLSAYQETSGMSAYQTVEGMSAYQPSGSYQTAGDYVSSSELADYQTTAAMSSYATTGDLAEKLDASASSSFITSTAGLATTSDLENYQPTSSMSAYATTGDLSAKLDASASSSFVTSTSDCMPLSASSNYATTAQLADKLDASASSSFITSTAGLATTSDLADYLPTSSIGTDTAGITSIAGTAIAGGGGGGAQVVTSITTGGYGVRKINDMVINASHMIAGAVASDNTSNIVQLGDSNYGAGVFLSGSFGTAYYKVNELQLNRNGTGFIGFNIGGAGSQITATSNAGGKFTAGGGGGTRSYYTAFNASASASIEVTGSTAKINLADSGYTATIYPSSIPYWNGKLDSSAIETDSASAITSIGGSAIAGGGTEYSAGNYIQISGDEISVTGINPADYAQSSSLADYQTTAGMSAYASTSDLSAKLDTSAIETSTAGITGIGGTSIAGSEQVVTSLQYTTVSATSDVGTSDGYMYDNFPHVVTATYLDSLSWETYTSGLYLHTVNVTGMSELRNYSAYPFKLYMLPAGATNDGYSDYQTTSTIAQRLNTMMVELSSCCIASAMSYEDEDEDIYQCIDFNVTSCPLVERGSYYSWGENGPYIFAGETAAPVFMIEAVGLGGMIQIYDLSTDFIFSAYTTSQLISGINELTLDYASTADVSSLSAEIGDINTLLQSI